jgi:hypothetical protein
MDGLLRNYLAGVAALLLVTYSISAGNDLVQVPLLLAGGLVVYEGLVKLVDDLRERRRR